ncbi:MULTISPECIES: nucleotide exchange factor GrpE [unclassified Limnobacter]|jgi:molecular chaperone GrpE|uniref:nucleotide exchange factor GrpE n=1 Tax=unclassified Limnobacter TaxID=2630203 RepID=UPI000156C1E5|nr:MULTISPECIES: nucleotide exchange factor GrpE [unclassified Limnobacter]EDM84239.1 Putative heat shock protein [Limnobacter sp. MED105]MAZ10398.1 nucleotide exchange factor GrpE [Sutterellaceae bacterium]MDP3271667.1 nucleotide exchange factor GrpE [Limnobacter sp.]|tara:strand:+ start:2199 stop:2798 length:600 start_codon:yes stop_codon:yes gene_type:complete
MSEPTGKPATDEQTSAQAPEGQQQGAQTQNETEQAVQQEAPQDEISVLKAALENAHHEVEKSKEVYLRLAADMENLRRRTQEDVAKAHKYAIESFAESLVPVRDSLEMALAVENQTPEALKDGVAATLRQLEAAFERGKVVVLNPVGEKFNPNQHQAVAMVPGDSVDPAVASNHVVAVLQKGYLINDRVLRPALVSVAQ